jgi:hypothetical protein
MLRMLHNPYFEVCLVVTPLFIVTVYDLLVFYGYERRLGSLPNVLSIVVMATAVPAFVLVALTLQVPILVRSLFNINFFFNLYHVATLVVCLCACFRGSLWAKVFFSLAAMVFWGVFLGIVHAVQLRRWLLLAIEIFSCCERPCLTQACTALTSDAPAGLLCLRRHPADVSHSGDIRA